MGLDMYLNALDDDGREVDEVYWRKVNCVHAWFVDNVQGGVDECEQHPVDVEQLARLCRLCDEAVAAYESSDLDRAEETMTPRGGFFFGSTDVDDRWASELVRTSKEVEEFVRRNIDAGGRTFVYQSSW